MRVVMVVTGILAAVPVKVSSASASCAEWRAKADVVVEGGRVAIDSGGRPKGLYFVFSIHNPRDYLASFPMSLASVAKRVEVRDESGAPVDLGPGWSRKYYYGTSHPPEWELPGPGGPLRIPARWLRLPKGGVYLIRAGFKFGDFPPIRGSMRVLPPCEVRSEWTRIEFHPVVIGEGGYDSPSFAKYWINGFLASEGLTGVLSWHYEDGGRKRVHLADLKMARLDGVTRFRRLEEVDALPDKDGVVHVVIPSSDKSTTYVKLGRKGEILTRTEVPGKKVLVLGGEKGERVELREAPKTTRTKSPPAH